MFNTCACLGPMYGEPYCVCEMKRRNLPLNDVARDIENKRAVKQWDEFLANGGWEKLMSKDKT